MGSRPASISSGLRKTNRRPSSRQVADESLQLLGERFQPRLAVEGFAIAVGDEDEGRLFVVHMFDEPTVTLLRLEHASRLAPDGVAAPAEVAKRDVAVGGRDGEQRLPVTVQLLLLDERPAQQNNLVAVTQGETVVRLQE